MLAGQLITFWSAIIIAFTGLAIVMVELGLLALVVVLLSKGISKLNHFSDMYNLGLSAEENKNKKSETAKNVKPVNSTAVNENEDEIAAIIVTVCEEAGVNPEEIIIKSIKQI